LTGPPDGYLPGVPDGDLQRIAAYALISDDLDRWLLVQAKESGLWLLPGGGVNFGEHPEECLRREVLEETGQQVATTELKHVLSDVSSLSGRQLHTVRLIYTAHVLGTTKLTSEVDGSTSTAAWVARDSVRLFQLAPFVRIALGA